MERVTRSVRSFSLESGVQTRLDELLVEFDNDHNLISVLIPSVNVGPAPIPPKPGVNGRIPWEQQFAYNQALKQVERLVKPTIKMNCSRLVDALLMLGMDTLQERRSKLPVNKRTSKTAA